jgi:hypothetical protein
LASFLSIASSLLVGVFLVVLPWHAVWDANYLLEAHPALRALLLSAFTRGAVTGLGLVNVLLALHDVHERLTGASEES